MMNNVEQSRVEIDPDNDSNPVSKDFQIEMFQHSSFQELIAYNVATNIMNKFTSDIIQTSTNKTIEFSMNLYAILVFIIVRHE